MVLPSAMLGRSSAVQIASTSETLLKKSGWTSDARSTKKQEEGSEQRPQRVADGARQRRHFCLLHALSRSFLRACCGEHDRQGYNHRHFNVRHFYVDRKDSEGGYIRHIKEFFLFDESIGTLL